MDPQPTADSPLVGRRRIDRTRDIGWWAITPLLTLLISVPTSACVSLIALNGDSGGGDSRSAFCADQAVNRCEEATLSWLALCAVMFAAAWLLLWLVPWWRGLRPLRISVAVLAFVLLLLAPLRLVQS